MVTKAVYSIEFGVILNSCHLFLQAQPSLGSNLLGDIGMVLLMSWQSSLNSYNSTVGVASPAWLSGALSAICNSFEH